MEDSNWFSDWLKAKIDEYDALIKPLQKLCEEFEKSDKGMLESEQFEQDDVRRNKIAVLKASREAYYDAMKILAYHP